MADLAHDGNLMLRNDRPVLIVILLAFVPDVHATGLPSAALSGFGGVGWFLFWMATALFCLPFVFSVIGKKKGLKTKGIFAGLYAFLLVAFTGAYHQNIFTITCIVLSFCIFNLIVFAVVKNRATRTRSHLGLVAIYLVLILPNPGIFNFVSAQKFRNDPFEGQGQALVETRDLEFARIGIKLEDGSQYTVRQNLNANTFFEYTEVGEEILLKKTYSKDYDFDIYVSRDNPIFLQGDIKPFFNFPKTAYATKNINEFYSSGPNGYAYKR